MSTQAPDRWQEIREIQKQHDLFYKALLIGLGVLIGAALFGDSGYITNLWTEGLSVALTVLILNTLAERREEKRRIRDLQERLVFEAGSQSNRALRAVHELRKNGWLEGESGLLREAYLLDTNLEGAFLRKADIQNANLKRANLKFADLQGTNLQGINLERATLMMAELDKANLREAHMMGANLQGVFMYADLSEAILVNADLRASNLASSNLQKAFLTRAKLQKAGLDFCNLRDAHVDFADLQGTDLSEANLEGVDFTYSRFDETTILPDGTNWARGTDLTRFTDPNHPNFWRSDNPASPAYRGD